MEYPVQSDLRIPIRFANSKIFIEEKIDDPYTGKSGEAVCYYFYCLYGRPQFVRINCGEKYETLTSDINWSILDNFYQEQFQSLSETVPKVSGKQKKY